MSEKLPWFKFYATDWISDAQVRNMSSRQKGWYIDLLAYAWQEDGLSEDPAMLQGLTSYEEDYDDAREHHDQINDYSLIEQVEQEFLAVVALFRTKLPGRRVTHPKIYEQRHKMQELSEARTKKARHAAESRWNAPSINKDATSMRQASPSIASSTENQKQEAEASSTEQASSTGGVLNRAAAAAASPPGPQANGSDPVQAAFHELAGQLPARYITNECGKEERNPVSERIDAAIRRALPRILAARMPVAFAKKVILDALQGA